MTFLRNTWYVAAWSSSVTRELLPRQIVDEPVLLYRKLDGTVAAIGDRCPHRFAPLSMGKLVGDAVECGYHGLQFDCSGECVSNPHGDGKIPRGAVTRAYPVTERHGFVWVWMGDPARADASSIPHFDHLTDPGYKTIGGEVTQEAHYELVVDNLMDLSHAMFLHADFQRTEMFLAAPHEVKQEGHTLHSLRVVRNTKAPASFRSSLQQPDAPVDYWLNVRWDAPGLCLLDIGVVAAGRPASEGLRRCGTHMVTPESPGRSRYFFASSRNYRQDDAAADEEIRHWQHVGFQTQDKPMVEAVARRMGPQTDLLAMKPILLSVDAAAVRARRILGQLMSVEAAPIVA